MDHHPEYAKLKEALMTAVMVDVIPGQGKIGADGYSFLWAMTVVMQMCGIDPRMMQNKTRAELAHFLLMELVIRESNHSLPAQPSAGREGDA